MSFLNIAIIKKSKTIKHNFFYSGLLKIFIEVSFDFFVVLFLELSNPHLNNKEVILQVSTILALFLLALYVFSFINLYLILSHSIIYSLNEENQNLGCLFEGMDRESEIWKYFTLIHVF